MKDNSPRFQPWETEPEQSSPAGRKNISAAPAGLGTQTMPKPTVKTVGYFLLPLPGPGSLLIPIPAVETAGCFRSPPGGWPKCGNKSPVPA